MPGSTGDAATDGLRPPDHAEGFIVGCGGYWILSRRGEVPFGSGSRPMHGNGH